MTYVDILIQTIFWTSAACIVYAYVGYPMLVWCLARLLGRSGQPAAVDPAELPNLSLLIAAYNEEAVIRARLENALAMDYPRDKLEIVVASDGSSDNTAKIVDSFADQGVRLLDYRRRRGKMAVLNAAVPELKGEIILLSDANTDIDAAAPKKLVRWFQDPAIGVVCGRLILVGRETGKNVDNLYWNYETCLKKCEGRLRGLLGANGAIYAMRKSLWDSIPAGTIVDDLVIPLRAKLQSGCEIIYDAEAQAREEISLNVRGEFRRRVRIGAGGYQSLGLLWRLLDPRRGWIAFTFFSHKILRWVGPFFLLAMLACNLWLFDRPFYRVLLLAQLGFYLLALLALVAPLPTRLLKPLLLSNMFIGMNAAFLVGFWRWLSGRQQGMWERTARCAEANGHAALRPGRPQMPRASWKTDEAGKGTR
jgi:cellulose synthase/poly-beta-1,6-N-acetylglucosamine synthase-like glycosyltransferase